MSGGTEKHTVAFGDAPVGVGGRIIARQIGFRFDDDSRADALIVAPHQQFAEEFLGHDDGVALVELTGKGRELGFQR